MDPCMQVSEVSLTVCRIGLPRHPVHPGRGVALEHEERLPEQIDAEVVEERGELLLLPLLSCLPYASERLDHTSPTLCPVCALLACVPLGPRPWLHRLRSGSLRLAGRPWDLPVPVQEASAHARVCDHAGSARRSRSARPCVWPSTFGTVSAPGMIGLSRFNGWPVHSPADASPTPLRASAHGSGPVRVATPSP